MTTERKILRTMSVEIWDRWKDDPNSRGRKLAKFLHLHGFHLYKILGNQFERLVYFHYPPELHQQAYDFVVRHISKIYSHEEHPYRVWVEMISRCTNREVMLKVQRRIFNAPSYIKDEQLFSDRVAGYRSLRQFLAYSANGPNLPIFVAIPNFERIAAKQHSITFEDMEDLEDILEDDYVNS